MAGLAYFTPVTSTVTVDGQDIEVRGLSLLDLTAIMTDHGGMAEKLFNEYVAGEPAPSFDVDDEGNLINQEEVSQAKGDTDVFGVIKALIMEAPELTAAIIAYAADEPDMADNAARIPGADQIKILAEIARLTFKSEAELGNLVDTVLAGLGSLTSAMHRVSIPMDDEMLPEVSPSGSGDTA